MNIITYKIILIHLVKTYIFQVLEEYLKNHKTKLIWMLQPPVDEEKAMAV